MDFALTNEQEMVVDTVRTFVERELVPHEEEVERLGDVSPDLVARIRDRSLEAGIYAANMPAELGGGGLDNLTMALEREELESGTTEITPPDTFTFTSSLSIITAPCSMRLAFRFRASVESSFNRAS